MPYSLNELGEVFSDADGVSWADAIKQQRALRSNESRVASMYAELDAIAEEIVEAEVVQAAQEARPSELVKIEIGKENEALTASLLERMDAMSQREALTTEALVAALHAIGTRQPVVNVEAAPAPNVTVEAAPPAEVNVDVHVPEQQTTVNVSPEIVLPDVSKTKTITFERDFDGRVTKADVVEGSELP